VSGADRAGQGVLIAEDGIDAATAVERLRTAARSSRQPVTDLVRDLIAGRSYVSYFDFRRLGS
jgi:hypothetical protein